MVSSPSLVSWLRGLITYINYQSNYYLREVSKKECQEETAQNKAEKLLTSLKRNNQSRRQTKRFSRVETLYSLSYSVIEIAQDSQVNMSLSK